MVAGWSRRRWALVLVVMLLVGVGLAFVIDYAATNRGAIEQGRARDVALGRDVAALRHALGQANARLRRTGEEPVPVPDVATPTPGPQGIPGLTGQPGEPGPGPTDAQVQAAVAVYCADTGACRGANGRDVTTADVAAAVATFCNARGDCAGPRGRRGVAGSPGSPGETVTGPPGTQGIPGPPPSAEAVAAAVQDYCAAHGQCQGPTGPAGPAGADSTVPGPQGPAGPPGPTCPDGFDPERLTVVTPQGGTRDILTCTPTGG